MPQQMKNRRFGKLRIEQVRAIRARYDIGEKVKDLSGDFDVSMSTVYDAISGRTHS